MNKKVINKYLPANLILKEQPQIGALVLGDCNSAVDLSIIKPNKIKTIISIGLQALPNKQKLMEGIEHYFYDIHDNKQQKLSVQLLDQVTNLIGQSRKRGGVLIHCYAGVSRSSSFVIAYIINTYKVGYDQAKEKVKKGRSCIHPGDGFVRHLQFYAKVIEKREQERLASLMKKQQKHQEKKQAKEQQEVNMKQSGNQISPSQRVRRGVRGAVRSAEQFSPQKIKVNVDTSNIVKKQKIEQKKQEEEQTKSIDLKQKQKEQKPQKLPPIQIKQSRYQKSSSVMQIKRNIDKIEGRSNKLNLSSIRGIYGNKTKVL